MDKQSLVFRSIIPTKVVVLREVHQQVSSVRRSCSSLFCPLSIDQTWRKHKKTKKARNEPLRGSAKNHDGWIELNLIEHVRVVRKKDG